MNQEDEKNTNDSSGSEESSQPLAEEMDKDAIRQGRVYPPPPEFYAAVPEAAPAVRALAPEGQEREASQNGIGQPHPQAPTSQQAGPGAYFVPSRGMPNYPQGGYHAPKPPRRSRAWIWIVSLFFGIPTILFCVFVGWLAVNSSGLINKSISEVVAMQQVGTDFYTSIQNQNYTQAHTYLATGESTSDLNTFTTFAKEQDQKKGVVQSYMVAPLSNTMKMDNEGQIVAIDLQVTVHRQNQTDEYVVILSLKKIGADWKIVSYSAL